MSLIEAYSGDEDDRRRLLRIDKLLQVRDTRVEFARKHHRNTNGSPMDFRDPYLHDIYNSLSPRIALQASVQCGKGTSLECPIHTPYGWKRMGDIRLGDVVSTPDGRGGSVYKITPLGVVPLYKITLSDGRQIEVTFDHLWKVFAQRRHYKPCRKGPCYEHTGTEILTTQQIMDRMPEERFSIPVPLPVEKPEKDLPLDPYFLGLMIGDGCLNSKALGLATRDHEVIPVVNKGLTSIGVEFIKNKSFGYRARCLAGKKAGLHNLRSAFESLDLLGKTSYFKFIPEIYKNGSVSQRHALLQGLMDSDGTSGKEGGATITFSSKQLAEDVQELAWSLGAVASLSTRTTTYTYKGKKLQGKPSYRVQISHPIPKSLFRLERHKERLSDQHRRRDTLGPVITKIEYSRHAEAQCIAIDHPDKLYIMDQYVVTHNSEFLIIDHFAMAKCGLSILFVLPKYDLRNRFVQNRINKCVERVPEYSKIMGSGFFDSVQLKYFGGGTINYVGSNVEKDFYEIPTNCAIVDEYDNCHQENLRFVADRMSAATNLYPFIRWAGNPRFSNLGINQKFNESDKREWSVPCEKCGTINQLDWFKHVVECVRDKMGNILSYELLDREWRSGDKRDIFMLCESCRNPINRFSPQGMWVPNNPEGTYEGYHISKLFTRQASVVSMWKDFVKSTANPSLMDWFYMSILGIPPSSQGNRVTPEIMAGAARAKEFLLAGNEAYVSEKVPGPCTMGIDVGSFLDIRISRVLAGKRVAVYLGRVNTQDEVYELMKRYNVEYAVIDCGPELHLVDEIQNSAPCSVWRCRFNSAEGKIQNISYDTSNMEIKVDRTFIMDRSLAQLRRGKNILPKNYDSVFGGDYLKQMTASVRERVLDPSGNERYEWMKTEDHHWLADCYDLLAADFMVDGTLTDIEVL